jgi:hypothetical protein
MFLLSCSAYVANSVKRVHTASVGFLFLGALIHHDLIDARRAIWRQRLLPEW